jgi:hypothetical protein
MACADNDEGDEDDEEDEDDDEEDEDEEEDEAYDEDGSDMGAHMPVKPPCIQPQTKHLFLLHLHQECLPLPNEG